jgi:hypothetical protein
MDQSHVSDTKAGDKVARTLEQFTDIQLLIADESGDRGLNQPVNRNVVDGNVVSVDYTAMSR